MSTGTPLIVNVNSSEQIAKDVLTNYTPAEIFERLMEISAQLQLSDDFRERSKLECCNDLILLKDLGRLISSFS